MIDKIGGQPAKRPAEVHFPESQKARQISSEGPKLPGFLARFLNFFWKITERERR